MYTRSTIEDYDRMAKLVDDDRWTWKSLYPYFKKNERFVQPADHHNTTGQFNPSVHGFNGVNFVSLQGYSTSIDQKVITATQQLGGDFNFVLDYNSGQPLGLGVWHT
jgi:choline dehydrogenase-like flavoprotein